MVAHYRWAGVVGLLVAGCLTLTVASAPVAPEIKDQGKFFSAEAVKKADEEIRLIAQKYDRDVLIETYPSPPADQIDKVKAMSAKERNEFFNKWALERAKFRVVRGLYIFLCKEPRGLFIEVSPGTRKVFTDEVRNQLFGVIRKEFAQGRFDEGLAEGLHFIEVQFARAKDK